MRSSHCLFGAIAQVETDLLPSHSEHLGRVSHLFERCGGFFSVTMLSRPFSEWRVFFSCCSAWRVLGREMGSDITGNFLFFFFFFLNIVLGISKLCRGHRVCMCMCVCNTIHLALRMQRLVSLIWSRLKYLNYYWMKCHTIWYWITFSLVITWLFIIHRVASTARDCLWVYYVSGLTSCVALHS